MPVICAALLVVPAVSAAHAPELIPRTSQRARPPRRPTWSALSLPVERGSRHLHLEAEAVQPQQVHDPPRRPPYRKPGAQAVIDWLERRMLRLPGMRMESVTYDFRRWSLDSPASGSRVATG